MKRKEEGQIYMDGQVKNKRPGQENWAGIEPRRGEKPRRAMPWEDRRGEETKKA